jgi:ankyrin repeat protein
MEAPAAPVEALLDAADAGDIDRLRELLGEGGVGVNDVGEGSWTALLYASRAGNVALINFLLDAGATIDQARSNGCTPLYIASQFGHVEAVKALIKAHATLNKGDNVGTTPIYVASHMGKLEVVKALIKAKATVDLAIENGATPLFIASQNGHLLIIKALIKAKAAINQAINDGRTPIYQASTNGHAPVVEFLIAAGARTAEPMFCDYAPLHIAAQQGGLACVKLLTGFRPDTPGWTTFLAGATSKKELAASLAPPGERPPSYLPKIFDRAYLEPIWKFQQERYSDLHLKSGAGGPKAKECGALAGHTPLELADHFKKTDVAKLLRGMMVLPKQGQVVGDEKKATKGGKE